MSRRLAVALLSLSVFAPVLNAQTVTLLDEQGAPAATLLEGGAARVRVADPGAGVPWQVDTVAAQVSSQHSGDVELVTLVETGDATGVFEGAIDLVPGAAPSTNGTLETAVVPGPPAVRDTVLAAYPGAAPASAGLVGARIRFLDPWGRTITAPAGHVLGQTVALRVDDALQNDTPSLRDNFVVEVVMQNGGDREYVQVTETGDDTSVFLGALPTATNSTGQYDGVLFGTLPNAMTAVLPHADGFGTATATLDWVGSRVEIVAGDGRPAADALESSVLRMRVDTLGAMPGVRETVHGNVSAEISGDLEHVDLLETGPATNRFEAVIQLGLGAAFHGDGTLVTGRDFGTPFRFDTATATFADGTGVSSDSVPLAGSRIVFVDAFGHEVAAHAPGDEVRVRLENHTINASPGVYDLTYVRFTTAGSDDLESIEMRETGRDTGIFEGSLPLRRTPAQSIDRVLQADPGDTITVEHDEVPDFSVSSATAAVEDFSLRFVEEDGAPAAVLVEDGTARLQMLSLGDNQDPFTAETVNVEVASLRTGDEELIQLAETGVDTGLFTGSFRLESGGATANSFDGRLQTATSGYTLYLPDQVTARRGPIATTIETAGSRITFRDEFGRPVTLYAAGEAVRVRVEDHNRNASPTAVENFTIEVRSLDGEVMGDTESVQVTESGFDTGIFLGIVPTTIATTPDLGELRTVPGGVVEASHFNSNSPTPTVARADVGGSVTLFITAEGAPAEVYLESSWAFLRVLDAFADTSAGADTTVATVTAFLSGDSEVVTLVETGGRTGVFEGSIRLRLGGAVPGNGTVETTEDPGTPFEADTLLASHADAAPGGGASSAEIGLVGSRIAFVDSAAAVLAGGLGREVDSYAAGSTVYVRVEDHNANQQPWVYDRVLVSITSEVAGDYESLELLETGRDTGVFTGGLPLRRTPQLGIDQILQADPGDVLTAEREDVLGNSSSFDTATVTDFSLAFVNEEGEVTAVLLEDGFARIRVFSTGDNGDPFAAQQIAVEVRSLHTGDDELVTLTETGADTGVFEGSIRLDSGSGGSVGGDEKLQTTTSGFPEYRPDRVTARRGPLSAVATTVGSRIVFRDGFGRPTTRYAAGETLHVEVTDHNRNSSGTTKESFTVSVRSLVGGETVSLEVTETNFDSGVFQGALPTTLVGGSASLLHVAASDEVEAEHFNSHSPSPTRARAEIGGSSVLFVDAAGQPAEVYLESSWAFLRVIDAGADGTTQVTVSAFLSGDQETVTLVETGPGTRVFEGSIRLRLGGAVPGDGVVETTEDAGTPHDFDRLTAVHVDAGGQSTASIGLVGSRTSFVDAFGADAESYAVGGSVYVQVEDYNANQQPWVYDRLLVELRSSAGDFEQIELVETGRDTSLFAASLPLAGGTVQSIDGVLQAAPGDGATVTVTREDVLGNSSSGDTAAVADFAIAFVDEAGVPTAVVLEDGTARIRVFSRGDNAEPFEIEQVIVEVSSLHTGDSELPALTETGPDTGLFEGTIRLDSGSGGAASGDGRLQTTTSGFPEYRPDRVTARRGPLSATAVTAGSRVTFLDEFGRPVPSYAVGERVRVRVEDHNRNESATTKESFTVSVRSLGQGDLESIEVTETNFDSGLFEGSVASVPAGGNGPGTLAVAGGDEIEAEHFNSHSPEPTRARVDVAGSLVLFVDAAGQPAEVYLESSWAFLRVIDAGADGTTEATVSAFLSADQETVTLVETGPGTRVFEGSIRLRLGGAVPGNGTLETTEDAGTPFEADTLIATHVDEDGGGGQATASIGLIGSRVWFAGSSGGEVDSYATGSAVHVRVEDHNVNQQPWAYDRLLVRVTSEGAGDLEVLELVETGRDTGVFAGGGWILHRGPALSADGQLQAEPGDTLRVEREDVLGNSSSTDTAVVTDFSIAFVDEAGLPTSIVLEDGVARIRVFSTGDNSDPFAAQQIVVEVQSLHTGDSEFPSLTETGPDTSVFEGTIRLDSGSGGAGSDGRLQTTTSGFPEYRPDRVTARRGPLSATATTAGSRVAFLDEFGRPAARYAAGERLYVQVTDHNRNESASSKESFSVSVRSLAAGGLVSVEVTETNFDTGVFAGSVASSLDGAAGTLRVSASDTVEAEHFNSHSPAPTVARAAIGGSAVLFVDAEGRPATVYLESSRAYLRVVDASASGTVIVQVGAFLTADQEYVTLAETAAGSRVFTGEIELRLAGAAPGNGVVETSEDPGQPFEFDRLTANYGEATATAGLTGSRVEFVRSPALAGSAGEEAESYAAGSAVYVRVEDHNANQQPWAYDRLLVRVTSEGAGDLEVMELVETGRDTNVFAGGPWTLLRGPALSADGLLQADPGDTLRVEREDVLGNSSSTDTATVTDFSLDFVDEAGLPTLVLLEDGTARIRVFSTGDNGDPFSAQQVMVEVQSLHTGDSELPSLTETGPDTAVFEGTIRLDSGSGGPGSDGRLQTTTSGFPEYRPDRVTARRGPLSATATTTGSRVTFLDGFGRTVSRYAVGERLYVQVTDHNRNQDPSAKETFTVSVRSLGAGGLVSVEMSETNFDSGVFTGSVATGLGSPGPGVLRVEAGDVVEAEHFNVHSPAPTVARAEIGAVAVAFVTAGGEPAASYLESSRAYLRVVDASAAGAVTVQVRAFLSGDQEQTGLLETSPGVFEGSIELRLGGAVPGNGAVETSEDPGLPFEFDTLIASYAAPQGQAEARAGLTGSRIALLDAFGNDAEAYAIGATVHVRVEDHNANQQPWAYDRLLVRLSSRLAGDQETLELVETGRDSNLFAGSLPLAAGTFVTDGVLQAQPGDDITAEREDVLGNSSSTDTARVQDFSLAFVDEAGAPTAVLLEDGLARVQLFSRGDNTDPFTVQQVGVEVQSLHTGDNEFLAVAETGPDTGVFEGSIRLDSGSGGAGNDGLLQTATSGFPEYRPDRVTARRGPVAVTATTAGSRVTFRDAFGRPVSSYAAGARLYVEVVDHNRNQDGALEETFTVSLRSLDGGDVEGLELTETGFASGVFTGSLATSLDGAAGTLGVNATDTVEAEHFNVHSPVPTVARAAIAGAAVLFTDAAGAPAEVYLESSRAYLRVTDANASGTVMAFVTSFLAGDSESVQLVETAPGSHVFAGSIGLALGSAQFGNGVVETTEDPGLPFEADTLRAAYPGVAEDEIGLIGSLTSFVDAAGQEAETYAAGAALYVRVEDHNADRPGLADAVLVRVSAPSGDQETVEVHEVGVTGGIFTGSLPLGAVGGSIDDGVLGVNAGERVTARHEDVLGNSESTDEALILAFSLGFVEADGAPTGVLVENGTARIQAFSRTDNGDPGQPDAFQVEVQSLYGGDSEFVTVTETGSNTNLFAGSLEIASNVGATAGDGLLQTANSGFPEFRTDRVTARRGPVEATAVLVGSRLWFLDLRGEVVSTYPQNATLRLRLEDYNRDQAAEVETVQIDVRVEGGDSEPVQLTETGPSAGTFEGILITTNQPGAVADGTLTAVAGDVVVARHLNSTPIAETEARAAIREGFAPQAVDDLAQAIEGQPQAIAVLANDLGTGPLAVGAVGEPQHGTVTLEPDGTVIYTGTLGIAEPDTFTYVLIDAAGGQDLGTVQVDVLPDNQPPAAFPDAASTPEDQARLIDVLGNDVDPDQDVLTVAAVTQPAAGGTVAINPDSTLLFTPAPDFFGNGVTFTYNARDPEGLESTGTVTVDVTPVNDPPVANDDAASTAEEVQVGIDVLANDTDLEGDTLSVTSVTQPTNGTAVINPDKTVTYTPATDFNGSDSFSYTISDGNGGTDSATVSITVTGGNDAPIANDDSASTAEDTAVTVAVRSNDIDLDGDALNVASLTQPSNGGAVLNADNTITYTPAADYNGTDSFSYVISDGNGGADSATVLITVTAVNDDPDAEDDIASTAEDTAVTVTVLANDADVDGDTLAVSSITQPTHGAAVLNADDTVTYTPAADYNGPDSFSYTVADGNGGTDTATVSIEVGSGNDAPVAGDDSATTAEDTAVTVTVLANDTDLDGDALTVSSLTQPSNGGAVLNADDTITYTPAADHNGADSFTYSISDGNGGTDTATVSITITAVNDAPVANDDPASTAEDTATTIAVLANDTDVDDDTLTVSALTQPAHGGAVLNANHTITYTPAADYNGPDSFTYTASDGNGGTDTATVSVNVGSGNDAPVANDDSASTAEDTAVTVTVLTNDTDLDGDTLTVSSLTQPSNGGAVLNADNTITYTPAANHNGADSFTYTVSDGNGGTDTATVSITITPVNDAPNAADDTLNTVAEAAATLAVKANDTDVDSPTLTVTAVTQGAHGTVVLNADQTVTYTPAAAYIGPDSFTYTLSDGAGGTDTATVAVTVAAPPRVASNIQVLYTFDEGTGTTVNDVSGVGTPLPLTIGNAAAVSWGPGFLAVNSATLLQTAGNATKVITACQASNQITMEAWVEPLNLSQTGPAPIVTVSQAGNKRDFTLGQSGSRYDGRLRTSTTNQAGSSTLSAAGSATLNLTHVAYTRDAAGNVRIYVDGALSASSTLTGNFSSWASYKLGIANELSSGQPWRGDLHLVAVYSRALSAAEVRQNFLAGAD